jgi:hypothetical protein
MSTSSEPPSDPARPGLRLYAGSGDVRATDDTVATLRRAGAVECLAISESNDGRVAKMADLLELQAKCAEHDITVVPCAFPGLAGDMTASRAWFKECCETLKVRGQLDAEPAHPGDGKVFHWGPSTLAPWLAMDCLGSITTTRAEAPHLGAHDRRVYAQLESEQSFDTLSHALRVFTRYTETDRVVLVTGLFDKGENKRTLAEIRADLHRATPQAIASGALAAWSCASMSAAEADAYREWACATWGVRP